MTGDLIFASYDFHSDVAANRPATPVPADGRLYVFLATDTDVISIWDGAAWTVVAKLGQLPGTATNDNAGAGRVGEYISSSVAFAGSVSVTSATPTDITSISLSAGDWDVDGMINTYPNGSTVSTQALGWTSATSATIPTQPNNGSFLAAVLPNTPGAGFDGPCGTQRVSLAGTTTIYLTTYCVFSVSTLTAGGFLRARRVR